jgi:hypothetical protein
MTRKPQNPEGPYQGLLHFHSPGAAQRGDPGKCSLTQSVAAGLTYEATGMEKKKGALTVNNFNWCERWPG